MILFVLWYTTFFPSFLSKSYSSKILRICDFEYFQNWLFWKIIRLGISNMTHFLYRCSFVVIVFLFCVLFYIYNDLIHTY